MKLFFHVSNCHAVAVKTHQCLHASIAECRNVIGSIGGCHLLIKLKLSFIMGRRV